MRNLIVIAMVACLFCGCGGQKKGRTEAELLEQYKTHHEQKNLEGTMSLFYQEETPEFILTFTREERQKNFEFSITSAEIVEIPTDEKNKMMVGFPYQGKTIVPNIEPLKQVEVEFDTSTQGPSKVTGETIMIGKVGNAHYFVLSKFK